MTTRRHLIASGLAAAAALATAPLATAPLAAQSRAIGAIRVDASRLSAQGWGADGVRIGQALQRELSGKLAPMIQRGGPTLHVTVKGVWLASWAGGGGGGKPSDGGASMDNFDSEYALLGPRGEVLATYPILSVIGSDSGGAWYLPDVDRRRVAALIENNALWIRRYLGG